MYVTVKTSWGTSNYLSYHFRFFLSSMIISVAVELFSQNVKKNEEKTKGVIRIND